MHGDAGAQQPGGIVGHGAELLFGRLAQRCARGSGGGRVGLGRVLFRAVACEQAVDKAGEPAVLGALIAGRAGAGLRLGGGSLPAGGLGLARVFGLGPGLLPGRLRIGA